VILQVFVFPPNHRQSHHHRRCAFPVMASAATFEPSSRMIAILFAFPTKVGIFVFNADFQRLTKAAQVTMERPWDSLVDANLCLKERAQMPCLLLPQQAAAKGDGINASSKV
jgi:hypothetical protein